MSLPRFGVERPVPINLLMVGTILGGVVAGTTLTKEFFPEITAESAQASFPTSLTADGDGGWAWLP